MAASFGLLPFPRPLIPLATILGFLMFGECRGEVANSFQFPLDGEWLVTQEFGEPDFPIGSEARFCGYHLGQDVRGTPGTVVHSVGNGLVKFAQRVATLGFAVHIQHTLPDGNEVTSIYYHLDASLIDTLHEGDLIGIGDIIGTLTGDPRNYGEGPHLHFGIRKGGYESGVDPRTEKWFYPGYTTIYQNHLRTCDADDPVHTEILAEWMDPEVFIDSWAGPTPIAENLIGPERLQLHDGFLYFADNGDCVEGQGFLKRVPVVGGNVETIVGGVTLFDANCHRGIGSYWVDGADVFGEYGGYQILDIFKAPKMGGVRDTLVSTSGGHFAAVIGNDVWFNSNFYEIWRIPRTGGIPEYAPNVGFHWIRESVQDQERLYFVEYGTFDVNCFDGDTVTTLLPWNTEGELALDEQYVYFHPSDTADILQVPKSGGAFVELVHTTNTLPEHGFASDSSHLFYLDGLSLMKVPVAGGSPVSISSIDGIIAKGMTVDTTFVYIGDKGEGAGAGRIWRFPK